MLALDPALPTNLTVKDLPALSASFSAAKELMVVTQPFPPSTTVSVVIFHSQADGERPLGTHTHTHNTTTHCVAQEKVLT